MQKYGRRYGRQRYRCNTCQTTFSSKKKPSVRGRALWKTYVLRRATLANLSVDDGRSPRQLQRVLREEAQRKKVVVHTSGKEPVVLVMDTTCFDTFGVMVFRCWNRRQNLFWTFVEEETNDLYIRGLKHLQETGFTVIGVVCDGKRWLAEQIQALGLPVRPCQFHFTKTMTRYLTKKPKAKAGRALRSLALSAKRMNEHLSPKHSTRGTRNMKHFSQKKLSRKRREDGSAHTVMFARPTAQRHTGCRIFLRARNSKNSIFQIRPTHSMEHSLTSKTK